MVRPMHELLEMLLSEEYLFKKPLYDKITHFNYRGLCEKVSYLHFNKELISDHEFFKLRKYIEENRPSKWSSFSAFKYRNYDFYWNPNNQKARIKWLKKHIKHTRYNHLNCIPNGK